MKVKNMEIVSKIHFINSLADLSGIMQNLWWLVGVFAFFVACLLAVFFFCKKTHKVTKSTINGLIKSKKYIPNLFVELNEGKEALRYFVYGRRWKKRIVEDFNKIYTNTYGDILKKAVKDKDRCFQINRHTKFKKILDLIEQKQELHELLRMRKYDFEEAYSESQPLFEICYRPYSETLARIEQFTQSAMSRYLILTGSAGNGKTNLLCSISELIMALNQAVIFLTARDIKGNPKNYVMNCLTVPDIFRKHPHFYWKIENMLLRLQQKYFYIVVDAVNENEDGKFSEELASFINEMLCYTRFKIIVSCRNEYYEVRFRENLVEKVHVPAFELDIKDGQYSAVALERIMEVYRSFFNFTGNISEDVKKNLYEQLLLLRIFFETNANSKKDVLSICKHELFKEYIDQVGKHTSYDTDKMLRSIARIMIDNDQYEGIPVSALEKYSIDIDILKKTIDESILIGKTIVTNKGTIVELEHEAVYFVFDELRDYVLAREVLLSNSDNAGNINREAVMQQIMHLKQIDSSALEGMIQYTYVFFRYGEDSEETCLNLLNLVRSTEKNSSYSYYERRNQNEFQDLGLRIILTTGLVLTEFEKTYIRECLIKNHPGDGRIVFDVMLKGTINGSIYNLNTYLDILFGIHDADSLKVASRTMRVRNSFDGYLPGKIEDVHRELLKTNPHAAMQVQQVAELFLLFFKLQDPDEQFLLEDYFCNLPEHTNVHDEMLRRINICLGRE